VSKPKTLYSGIWGRKVFSQRKNSRGGGSNKIENTKNQKKNFEHKRYKKGKKDCVVEGW
jgi:hypothetical protein